MRLRSLQTALVTIMGVSFFLGLAQAAVQTSLSYDYLGRVIQVTEQGQTEDYFYSGEKRVFKKEASGKKRLYLFEDHSVVFDREVEFGKRGDADGTGTWTITDAVYLINYIFAGGSSPKPNLLAGDADGNSIITIGDAVWLINFIFAGSAAPSSATLSLSGAANVFAPGAGRLWSDGAMGNEDLYFVEDPVSSTSAVLAGNALGEVIQSTPFGEQLTTSNLEKRYLFTGKELDATTGLFYYGARYYDPALGRFLQWDSVMDGANRYLYVRNNPINANDPSGHDWSLFNSAESSTTSSSIVPAPAFENATIGAPSYSSIMNERMQRQAQVSLEPTGILSPVDQWAMENFDGPESASRGEALLTLSNFAMPIAEEIGVAYRGISSATKFARFDQTFREAYAAERMAIQDYPLQKAAITDLMKDFGISRRLINTWESAEVTFMPQQWLYSTNTSSSKMSLGVFRGRVFGTPEIALANDQTSKEIFFAAIHESYHALDTRSYAGLRLSARLMAQEYPAWRVTEFYRRNLTGGGMSVPEIKETINYSYIWPRIIKKALEE